MIGFEALRRIDASLTQARRPVSSEEGVPIDAQVRSGLERSMGHDFSRVRVHADVDSAAVARRHGGRAVASGNDLWFASSQYRPHTANGKRLLAHELAHIVQKARGGRGPDRVSRATDPSEVQARAAVAGLGWGGLHGGYSTVTGALEPTGDRRLGPVAPILDSPPALLSCLELSYDDGPDTAGNTRRVLDALGESGARATFYLVGKRVLQADNWQLVFDMAAGGHWLGNHAYDWDDSSDQHIWLKGTVQDRAEKILWTELAIRDALLKGREDAKRREVWSAVPPVNRAYIEDVIAYGTGRFRTPGFASHFWKKHGFANKLALFAVNQTLAASGLRTLAITEVPLMTPHTEVGPRIREGVEIDPHDYEEGKTKDQIVSEVVGRAEENSSVLLHSRVAATAAATPEMAREFQRRGYRFNATVRGIVGQLPKPGFAGLTMISDPPTSAQIETARAFFRKQQKTMDPNRSGSLAVGILALAQRAGTAEVDSFLAEIYQTTVQTWYGPVPLADWMMESQEWDLFVGFYEDWQKAKRPRK